MERGAWRHALEQRDPERAAAALSWARGACHLSQVLGSNEERQLRMHRFGNQLAIRLETLHAHLERDWPAAAAALGLDATEAGRREFWRRLHRMFVADADHEAVALHAGERGWARVAKRLAVVPTGLPAPFDGLVQVTSNLREAAAGLAQNLVAVAAWPSMLCLADRLVAHETAAALQRLGVGSIMPMTLADVLGTELELADSVTPETAYRLGKVFNFENSDIGAQETEALKAMTRSALFRTETGTWRPAAALVTASDMAIAGLVPDGDRLSRDYGRSDEPAGAFFRLSKAATGATVDRHIKEWLDGLTDPGRRRTMMQALAANPATEDAQRVFGVVLRSRPSWLSADPERLLGDLIAWGLSGFDANRLVLLLVDKTVPTPVPLLSIEPVVDDDHVDLLGELEDIHAWWQVEGAAEAEHHDDLQYPAFLEHGTPLADPTRELDDAGRLHWFTLMALARFQAIGRTQVGAHCRFIENADQEGWWAELARPPRENVRAWTERLERWSDPLIAEQPHQHWRTTFVDLYAISRALPDYADVLHRLPRIIRSGTAGRVFSFASILQPGASRVWERMGRDAPSMRYALNAGVNWLVRELLRHGHYRPGDLATVAPYGFTASGALRRAVRTSLDQRHPDLSHEIFEAVAAWVGAERAAFGGDLDLPLQIVAHRGTRQSYLDWRNTLMAAE